MGNHPKTKLKRPIDEINSVRVSGPSRYANDMQNNGMDLPA